MKKRYDYLLVSCLIIGIGSICFSSRAEEPTEEAISIIKKPPVIDGNLGDPCWDKLVPITYRTGKGQEIVIYAGHNYKTLYMAFKVPSINKETRHLPWEWHDDKQAYLPNDAITEFTLTLVWSEPRPDGEIPDLLDVWIWRSARTNRAGYADDFNYRPLEPEKQQFSNWKLEPDEGKLCWYSKYFSSFAGKEVPRFYSVRPTKSCADIEAAGKWENGYWTIELKRKLDTGHDDDITLKLGVPYMFYISYTIPVEHPDQTENDRLKLILKKK